MDVNDLPPVIEPEPGAVPYSKAVLRLWGDETSGQVPDWIYVCNTTIQQTMLSMPPGKCFRHSDRYRTFLGADELYYVLEGRLALANPETGEVHVAGQGEALWFQKDTWHHGFNCGTGEVRIIEYFAPPGPAGGSQVYARSKPLLPLDQASYTQDEWLGRWPMAAEEAAAKFTQHVIARDNLLWRLEGTQQPMLVGIYFSTANLTVGCAQLLPGQASEPMKRGSDTVGFVLNGRLNLFFPGGGEVGRSDGRWHEMHQSDGFYIPADWPFQYFNMTGETVNFLFAAGGSYR
jgi:mannose-6-phosphate isomerase-like protein (cupin superfamily)